MLTNSHRYLALAAGALSLLATACADADRTLGPTVSNTPTSPAPPPPPVSRTLPPWPSLPDGAEAYYEIGEPYAFYSDYHGAIRSRYVFFDTERFSLQCVSARFGAFEYKGRFERTDSTFVLHFDGWSVAGPWIATGTLSESQFTVSYNLVMALSDFMDATYVRRAVPPE